MSDLEVRIKVLEARGLQRGDRTSSDPFVVAKFKGLGKMLANKAQTSVVHNTLNPVWNQELQLYPKTTTDTLLLKVYDHDTLTKDNLLGMIEIPLDRFFQRGGQDNWFQLMNKKFGWKSMMHGHPVWHCVPGTIHIQLWFGLSRESSLFDWTHIGQQQYQSNPFAHQNTALNQPFTQPLVQNASLLQTAPLVHNAPLTQPIVQNAPIVTPLNASAFSSKDAQFSSGFHVVDPATFGWYSKSTLDTKIDQTSTLTSTPNQMPLV